MRRIAFLCGVSFLLVVPACGPGPAPVDDTGTVDAGGQDARVVACTADPDCDDGVFCNGVETCSSGNCIGRMLACDDGIGCTTDVCNETARSCLSRPPDADSDGFGDAHCLDAIGIPLGTDCDDADAMAFPGNTETCDAHDEDCNPSTLGGSDDDHDGAVPDTCCNPSPAGVMCGRDCDDTRANISQLASETCDGVDNDCDRTVDEDALQMSWPDVDGDGFGDASATPDIVCVVPSSRANEGGDCNDRNGRVHPFQSEDCNAVDDDCNGSVDEGASIACVGSLTGTTAECVAGACVVTGCAATSFDCNGLAADGCEATLCDTSTRCGQCSRSCGTSARLCDTGQCVLTVAGPSTIDGAVIDATTGMAVSGATITSVDICPIATTTTRADGTYSLPIAASTPRWVIITRTGYPPHVQLAGELVSIFSSAIVDAWRADPDASATASDTRAIVVVENGGAPVRHGYLGNGSWAVGGDLLASPMTGSRMVFLGAVPGLVNLGGGADLGGGCSEHCDPTLELWLQGGAVTHVPGFACGGVC
jgi:hypothetical protein